MKYTYATLKHSLCVFCQNWSSPESANERKMGNICCCLLFIWFNKWSTCSMVTDHIRDSKPLTNLLLSLLFHIFSFSPPFRDQSSFHEIFFAGIVFFCSLFFLRFRLTAISRMMNGRKKYLLCWSGPVIRWLTLYYVLSLLVFGQRRFYFLGFSGARRRFLRLIIICTEKNKTIKGHRKKKQVDWNCGLNL